MREIKIKFWNHIVGRMSEPYTLEELHKEKVNWNNVKPLEFTGLRDNKSVNVYEGDILQFGAQMGSISEVKFIRKNAGFLVKDKFGDWQWLYDILASTKAEVIGNIYENPELLQ